jgi:hypothetical protein
MRIRLVAVAAAIGPLLAAAQAAALPAVQFGFIGLARGETLRVNVVNASTDPAGTACIVQATFFDDAGVAFGDRDGSRVSLLPGHGAWVDLPASMAFGRDSRSVRTRVRATVQAITDAELPPNPCDGIVSTEELFDNLTGRTTAFSTGRSPGPPEANPGPPDDNPGPPEVFGLVGLAPLQALSITAVNLTTPDPDVPPSPCRVRLTFVDAAGSPFINALGVPVTRAAPLLPGEILSLALPAATAFGDIRLSRVPVRVKVEVDPGPAQTPNACSGVTNTLELIDLLTARTSLVVSAGSQAAAIVNER